MNETKKSKRFNDNEYKRSRIIEVGNENDTSKKMAEINQMNLKYEMFCKWLQQNEQMQISNDDHNQPSSITLTEDEVSSLVTNNDDSDDDEFLDTETDVPIIVLTDSNNESLEQSAIHSNVNDKLSDADFMADFRVDSPSQLSVNSFDCNSSDVTDDSRISETFDSSYKIRRKAKHKKGRAPPIPIESKKIDASKPNETNSSDGNFNLIDALLSHPTEFSSIMRSTYSTDI